MTGYLLEASSQGIHWFQKNKLELTYRYKRCFLLSSLSTYSSYSSFAWNDVHVIAIAHHSHFPMAMAPWPHGLTGGLTAVGGLFRIQSFPGRLGFANGTGGALGTWPSSSDHGIAG